MPTPGAQMSTQLPKLLHDASASLLSVAATVSTPLVVPAAAGEWPHASAPSLPAATANGVVFMLIEDEFGAVNLIVPPTVYDRHRAIVRGEPLILARGRFERIDRNQNVLVHSLETLGPLARQVSQEPEVGAGLPGAHHFGHR